MPNFLEAVKASQSDLVYLASGKDNITGNNAWHYLQISSKGKVPLFLKNIKTGINLTDYGTILYSGWGEEPPEEIRLKIKEQFG